MAIAQPDLRRVLANRVGTSGLSTDNNDAVYLVEKGNGGLVGALIIRGLTGTAPSITGLIQHSPDPASVSDAAANWFTLLTFTAQTANGAQIQTLAAGTSYFTRLRAQVVRGGTAVTNLDYEMVMA